MNKSQLRNLSITVTSCSTLIAVAVAWNISCDTERSRGAAAKDIHTSTLARTKGRLRSRGNQEKIPPNDRKFALEADELEHLPLGDVRKISLIALASTWAGEDINAALAWAAHLEPFVVRADAITAAIRAAQDPSEIARALDNNGIKLGPLCGRTSGFPAMFLLRLARDEGHAATLDWVGDHFTGGNKVAQIALVLGDLINVDPGFALDRFKHLTRLEKDYAMLQIVQNLVQTDPISAVRFLKAESGSSRMAGSAYARLVGSWLQTDPIGLETFVRSEQPGPSKDSLVLAISGQMAMVKPEDAMQWLREVGDGVARNSSEARVLKKWTSCDPAQAANYVATLEGGQEFERLMPIVLDGYARTKPVEAGSWVLGTRDEATRNGMAVTLTRVWFSTEPEQAAMWVDGLAQGSMRDASVAQMVDALAARNPDTALQWANTVVSDSLRKSLVSRISSAYGKEAEQP